MTQNKQFRLIAFLIAALMAGACAKSSNPDVERGSMFKFQDGHPEVRLSAIGLLNEQDEAVIKISADVVYGSLIYRSENDGSRTYASVTIEVRITGKEGTDFRDSFSQAMEIESNGNQLTQSQEFFSFDRQAEVIPGEYDVFVTVKDNTSGKATTRETSTVIPDPENPVVNLTSVRMLGKNIEDENQYLPVTTYDVPSRIDSLQFVFQVTNNTLEDPLTIRTRVIKFRADSTIARPMNYNNYNVSSVQYKGIDFDKFDEVDSSIRRLDQAGSVLIEFNFERFRRGNYRFEVETGREGQEPIFKARDFSIKSENYPAVKSSKELARPLYYLMDEDEYEEMMQIQNPDSLKQAIDRFWLSNVRSVSDAKNVIKMYYERVEEANKQFSNFKEGWKTDTGMIYILFGPPWFVETSVNQMLWSYSYDRSDPRYNYFFERPRMPNEFYPFNNYLLERNQQYFNVQYQQVQRWLNGSILRRGI